MSLDCVGRTLDFSLFKEKVCVDDSATPFPSTEKASVRVAAARKTIGVGEPLVVQVEIKNISGQRLAVPIGAGPYCHFFDDGEITDENGKRVDVVNPEVMIGGLGVSERNCPGRFGRLVYLEPSGTLSTTLRFEVGQSKWFVDEPKQGMMTKRKVRELDKGSYKIKVHSQLYFAPEAHWEGRFKYTIPFEVR